MLHDEDRSVVVSGIVTLALVPASLAHEYAIAFLQGLRRFRPFNILRMLPVALYTAAVLAFLRLRRLRPRRLRRGLDRGVVRGRRAGGAGGGRDARARARRGGAAAVDAAR